MRVRSWIPFTILPAIACSPSSDSNSPFGPSQSNAERQDRPAPVAQKAAPAGAPAAQAPAADLARRLAGASNGFGFALYARLGETPGNLVFSPASLSLGLSLPWAGARGETDTAFRQVLHLDASPSELLPAWGQLVATLQDPAAPVTLRVANRLFGEKSYTFEPAYLEMVRAAFGTTLVPIDFSSRTGTHTFGTQTHPADGNAGMIVTTREQARALSADPAIEVELLGFGQARVEKGYMPLAPAPAAQVALQQAGLSIKDVDAVKTHNPFAANDIAFARETGFPLERMNNFGCSLIWGHPQGPTGLRSIIELIEELALRGGGYGLLQGCAAGDTGMAVVIKVGDK